MAEFRSRYFISGEINSEVADQEAKMEEIAERYSDGEITRLDGVSVDYPDWHFNVRPSNTEPLLRLNLESLVSREDMERQPRRGPGADPLVTPERGARARALRPASTASGSRRPFAVGRVNCYLIEDEPLTLVDTGPNSGKALDELEHQLAERGHSIDDLELVILTHQHIDHLGLVEIIAAHSGAEVAAIDVAVPLIENFGEDAEREDEFAVELMLRNGIPEEVVFALQSVSRSFRGWGAQREGDAAAPRRRGARARRPQARGPAPARPQPLGHGLLGRRAAHPDRRRPPDRAHLLEPADHAARSTARPSAPRRSSPTSTR